MHKLAIVPFDVAEDLKKLGFNWPCRYLQVGDSSPLFEFQNAVAHNTNETPQDGIVSAPEQSLVVKWLLDIHNLYVVVEPHFKQWFWEIRQINTGDSYAVYYVIETQRRSNPNAYKTHEEAQLNGIKECIKYLKNEKMV